MTDPSAAEGADQVGRSVLEAVDERLKYLRDDLARLTVESQQRQREAARLASELGRWLTAKTKEDAAMTTRLDELEACVKRLSHLAQDKIKS